MKKIKKYFLLNLLCTLILGILCISPIYGKEEYPKPTQYKYVNDYANIIKMQDLENIVSIGKELEDKTGAQAVIVTINSLDGRNLEEYAHGIFQNWGIGNQKKNNGLLILVSKKDRKWRVEVGTGLEGVITDIESNRIMEKYFKPQAKNGEYGKGLKYSYSVISDNIAKEYNVKLNKNQNIRLPKANSRGSDSKNANKFIGILIALILIDVFLNKGRGLGAVTELLFWDSLFNKGRRRFYDDDDDHDDFFGGFGGGSSGGGFGGFGGGSSSGGGSSGSW